MKLLVFKDRTSICRPSRFAKEESGSITIFALFMVIIMMMVCGIGVDMMRHEMERTRLQATADRAVLAAADLDQTLDATDVVLDYFQKAGLGEYVTADDITPNVNGGFKSVSVDTEITFPTQFMDYFGVDELTAWASSTAEERTSNVEIALILDTSASMSVPGRLDALKPAAVSFVNTVLAEEYQNSTSVTLIPYGGQTNPGPVMFDRLNGVRLPATALDEAQGGIPEYANNVTLPDHEVGGVGSEEGVRYVHPNLGSCLETHTDGFDTIGLPNASSLDQVPYFMTWGFVYPDIQHWGWCPRDTQSIQYHTNNRDQLNTFIEGMRTYDGTGTHYAMKWATALLDSDSADDIRDLVDPEFQGRPAAYTDRTTAKYIVLMTDGEITDQYRPIDAMNPRNIFDTLWWHQSSWDRELLSPGSSNFANFLAQCNLAKGQSPQPVVIYTIAFQGNDNARAQMRACASSVSHYFTANTNNIDEVFKTIARSIHQLRLTN